MARRVPVSVLMAPATIYQHAAVHFEGYAPAEDARFAVVARRDKKPHLKVWTLVHRRSGMPVNSILPNVRRKLGLVDKLAVAAAFHAATHLNWAPFDAIPELTPGTGGRAFAEADRPAAERTADELRKLAAQALGVGV